MACLRIYTKDLGIASALINRDERVIREYYYSQCYPLFKSVYDNYFTDCGSCMEFMHEIYLLILTPGKTTGRCQLQNYRGESSLASWLKAVCLFYCYAKYERRPLRPAATPTDSLRKKDKDTDRFLSDTTFYHPEFDELDRDDVETILALMPNKRYSTLMRLRYLEQKSNEETAEALGMSMDNYYNKHKLAKEQYIRIYRKEERNG